MVVSRAARARGLREIETVDRHEYSMLLFVCVYDASQFCSLQGDSSPGRDGRVAMQPLGHLELPRKRQNGWLSQVRHKPRW